VSRRLSFGLPTIMLFCPGAPKPGLLLSYQWPTLTVKTSMFHLQCIVLSKTCCSKNAEAAENGHAFYFLSVFQRSVTHSRAAREAHQAVTIKARVCCVRVRSVSILVCIILAVASVYTIFSKSKMFPNFLSSLHCMLRLSFLLRITPDQIREIRIQIYLPFWPDKVLRDLHCWEWQQSNISFNTL
jgi:hypothetical protein